MLLHRITRAVQFRFLLILSAAMLLAFLTSYVIAVYSANQQFNQELEKKHKSLSTYANILADPVWNFNTPIVIAIQQSMLLDPNIMQVEVFDESHNLLHSAHAEQRPDSETVFTFEAPIIYSNAHITTAAGTLKVVISNASLLANKSSYLKEMLTSLGLVILALSAGVAVIQFRVLGGPIKQLHHAIHRSKQAATFALVPQAPDNELGDIIRAFNDMQGEIQHKHAALEQSEKRFRTLYHATPALLFSLSRNGIILDASQYLLDYLNYSAEQVINKKLCELFCLSADAGERLTAQIWQDGALKKHPLTILSGHGTRLHMQLDVEIPATRPDQGALAVMTDVSQLKRAHQELDQQARTDSLSGQPNRFHFQQQLDAAIATLEAQGGQLAVMFLDLDRFKSVNDTFGHTVGDQLIRCAGQRIAAHLRPDDMLARLGGDEFAIILKDASHTACRTIAQRILQALDQVFLLADSQIFVSSSIGIALYPADANSPEGLLQLADIAMYRAKYDGGGGYSFYIPEKEEQAQHRQSIEKLLRNCLVHNSLELHYQPIIDLVSGQICGAEALLRLKAPDGVLIYPGQFIALAEESGLIIPIGEWCIRQACKQLAQWQQSLSSDFYLSVNVSPRQLQSTQFLPSLQQALANTGVPAESLVIEITESLLIHDNPNNQRIIQAIDETGCQIAIDDFGTGYSALSYLMTFPVDILKIDRSFIHNCVEEETSRSLVNAILNLSESLKLRVITEGIETAEQLQLIRQAGCTRAQGYYFSRPIPAAELTAQWSQLHQQTAARCAAHTADTIACETV